MPYKNMIEKFSNTDLSNLRNELMQSGLDSWQAAQVVSNFLSGRGYGVNSADIRDAVMQLEGFACSPECMQSVLETVAFVM